MRVTCCILVSLLGLTIVSSQSCLSEDIERDKDHKYKSRILYKGLTIFTASFLKAMHEANPNENLFFSPFSLYHALLLAYFGAGNQTEKSLKQVLQLQWAQSKAEVFEGYKYENNHRHYYHHADAPVQFSSVDRFYFDKSVELNPCVGDVIVDGTDHVDFRNDPQAAVKKINNFVSNVTKGNIPNLLSPADITQSTKIVLANAAFFKGSWASKFDAANTNREIFYSRPDEMNFVQMMSLNGSFNHGKNCTKYFIK